MTYITIDNTFLKRCGNNNNSTIKLDGEQMNRFKKFIDKFKDKWYSMFIEQDKGDHILVYESKKKIPGVSKDIMTREEYKREKRLYNKRERQIKEMKEVDNLKDIPIDKFGSKIRGMNEYLEEKIKKGKDVIVVFSECKHHKKMVEFDTMFYSEFKEHPDLTYALTDLFWSKKLITMITDNELDESIRKQGFQLTFAQLIEKNKLKDRIISKLKNAIKSSDETIKELQSAINESLKENNHLFSIIMDLMKEIPKCKDVKKKKEVDDDEKYVTAQTLGLPDDYNEDDYEDYDFEDCDD